MSVPVEVYVVVCMPAVTVILPPARTPRSDSGVLVESAAVPVPVAATGTVVVAADEVLVDDEVCPVLPFRTFWIAAVSWVLMRFRAV